MKNRFIDSLKSLTGVITHPGATLGKVMEKKQWVAAFVLIIITLFIYSYVSAPLKMAKLSEFLSEEELQYLGDASVLKSILASLLAIFLMFIVLAVAAFFTYLFYGIGQAEGLYGNYFALVTCASVIDTVIPMLLRTLSILLNIDIVGYSNLVTYIPFVTPYSLGFFVLSQVDVFALWYLGVVAAGVAVFSRMRFRKSLFIGILYFCFKLAVIPLFSYLRFKIMGM